MKLIDLFEQQQIIKGNVRIPVHIPTLVRYKHKGIPIVGAKVLGNFDCHYTKIESLEGGPSWVGGDFDCSYTSIESLEGGPSWVGKDFDCHYTEIPSLHNVHKQIEFIGGILHLPVIDSHILGVMFIKGLKEISISEIVYTDRNSKVIQVIKIINKHLGGDRNIHDAQEQLIEAGLAEFAKL